MLKRPLIIFCLLAFTFQAIVFNVSLFAIVLFAKLDDGAYTKQMSLNPEQYRKLAWVSENEFSIGTFLFDVKEIKRNNNTIVLLCKVDLKEKNFLEKLIEDFKNTKNKKPVSFGFPYKVSEPYQLRFIADSKEIHYTSVFVFVDEIVKDKYSPPPKA